MVDRDINIKINGDTTNLENKIRSIEQHIKQLQADIKNLDLTPVKPTGEAGAKARQFERTSGGPIGNPQADAKEAQLREQLQRNMEEEIRQQKVRLSFLKQYNPALKKEQWEPLDPGPKIVTEMHRNIKEGATTYKNAPIINAKLSPYEVERFRRISEERTRAREMAQKSVTSGAISSNYLSAEALSQSDIQMGTSIEDLMAFIPYKKPVDEGLQTAAASMHGPWIEAFRKGKLRGKAPANIKAAHARQKPEPIDYMKTQGLVTGISGFDFNEIFEAVSRWGDVENVPTAEELDKVISQAAAWAYIEKVTALRQGDIKKFYKIAPKVEGMLTALQRGRTRGRFEDLKQPGQLALPASAKGGMTRENVWMLGTLARSFIPQRPSELMGDFGSTHRVTQQLDSLARMGLAERVVSMHALPPEMWAQTGMQQIQNVFANSMNRWTLTGAGRHKVGQLGISDYPGYLPIETPLDYFTRKVSPEDVPNTFGVEEGQKKQIEKIVGEKAPGTTIWKASRYTKTPEYTERFRETMNDLYRYRQGLEPQLLSKETLEKIDKQMQFGPEPTTEKNLDLVKQLNVQASTSYQYAQPQATESQVVMDALRIVQGKYASTTEGKKAQAQDIFEMLSSKRLRSRISTKEDALEITSMVADLVKTHGEMSEQGEPTLSPDQYRDILNFWSEIEGAAAPGVYGRQTGVSPDIIKEQEAALVKARGGMEAPAEYARRLKQQIGKRMEDVDERKFAQKTEGFWYTGESQLSNTILYNKELAGKAGFPEGWLRTWFDIDKLKEESINRFAEQIEAGNIEAGGEQALFQSIQETVIKEAYEKLPRNTYGEFNPKNVPINFRVPSSPQGPGRGFGSKLLEETGIPWEERHPVAREFRGPDVVDFEGKIVPGEALPPEQLEVEIARLKKELGPAWEEASKMSGQLLTENLYKEDWKKLSKFEGAPLTPLQSMIRAKEEAGIGPSKEPGIIPRANVASMILRAAQDLSRKVETPPGWREEASYRGLGADVSPRGNEAWQAEEEWLQKTFEEMWGAGEEEEEQEPEQVPEQEALITPELEGGKRARRAEAEGKRRRANLGLVAGVGLGLPIPGNVPNPIELIGKKLKEIFPKKTPKEQLDAQVQNLPKMFAINKGNNALDINVNMDITKPDQLQKLQELAKQYPEMTTRSWTQTLMGRGGMKTYGRFVGTMGEDIRGLTDEEAIKRAEELRKALSTQFNTIATGAVTVDTRYVPALDKAKKATLTWADAGEFLGKLSWKFTMLSMNALGVFFSMMSIVRILQQGLATMFTPLKNVETLIEDIGWLQSRGIDANLTPSEAIDGWMKLKDLAAMFTTTVAKAAVNILDKDTYESLKHIMEMIGEFLTKPEITEIFQNIFKGLEKNMPAVLDVFETILGYLEWISQQDWLVPFLTWGTMMSWLLMPFLSILSAVTRMGQLVAILVDNWKLIAWYAGLTETASVGAAGGAVGTAAAGSTAAYGASGYTLGGATAGAAGAGAATLGLKGSLVLASQLAVPVLLATMTAWTEHQVLNQYADWIKSNKELYETGGGKEGIAAGGSWSGATGWEGANQKPIIDQILAGETVKWYAGGGTLRAGEVAIVGEEGPEMIVPSGDTEVIPNKRLRFLADGTGASFPRQISKDMSADQMIQILNNNYKEASNMTKINEDIDKVLTDNGVLNFTQSKERNETLDRINAMISSGIIIDKEQLASGKSIAEVVKQVLAKMQTGGSGMPGYPITFGSAFGVNPPTNPYQVMSGGGGAGGAGSTPGGGGATGTDWSIDPTTGKPTFTGMGPTTYTPGKDGAPSVKYPTNPYATQDNAQNDHFWEQNGQWWYRDARGVVFKTSAKGVYPEGATRPGSGQSENLGPVMTQLESQGVEFENEQAQNDNAVKYAYMAAGGAATWGSIEEYAKAHGMAWYGTVSSTDLTGKSTRDYKWNQKFGGGYPSLAVGGFIGQSGLVNAHAGEIISPIEKILPSIREGSSNTTVEGDKEVNINVTINGNADSRTVDEMVSKIKRELFGVGWV